MARILIVDDEGSVRTLLRVVLEQDGYEVAEAATADVAVALNEERPAGLLITDLFLPEADALTTMLGLVNRHPEMKVIAVSGAANQDLAVWMAKLLRARGIMQKPFDLDELRAEVRVQIRAVSCAGPGVLPMSA